MSAVISRALEVAEALCIASEGLRTRPYICPAGYPTIGYGTVNKPDGTKVTMGHPTIDKATALAWLRHELRHTYMVGVLKASPNLVKHPEALGALTDFAYNLGVPRYRASTLCRKVNEEDWAAAGKEILKWNKGGGRVLPGLTKRRQVECSLLPK